MKEAEGMRRNARTNAPRTRTRLRPVDPNCSREACWTPIWVFGTVCLTLLYLSICHPPCARHTLSVSNTGRGGGWTLEGG